MQTLRHWAVVFTVSIASTGTTFAQTQKGRAPPLPKPPPYGAYFLDNVKQDRAEYFAALDAIAKHYGYKDENDAYRACLRAKTEPNCSGDIVAHRRAASPEIAKYGFATWKEAVWACLKNNKGEFGPVKHCTADPFLKLRVKK